MTSTSKTDKRERVRRNRKKGVFNSRVSGNSVFWWIIGGVLILVALSWFSRRSDIQIDPSTQASDIIYGESILAVHEMGGADLASIDFLPEDGPQPTIAVSELLYDFGSVGLTEVVQHEFVLSNLGEAPLSISRAYTTCGCTTAELSASEIPPGKAIRVTLTFDAGYHDTGGQRVKRGVVIESNDPKTPEFVFWTEADVRTTP